MQISLCCFALLGCEDGSVDEDLLSTPVGLGELDGGLQVGDGEVFATLPTSPGFPEGIAIFKKKVYVSTPATFGTAGSGASVVYVYDLDDGSLLETLIVSGENLAQEHALTGVAVDKNENVYVISTQLGIIRFVQSGGGYTQEQWSTPFPDLVPTDMLPPLPNDMAFDKDGNLYVTDTYQGLIWKVSDTGGTPQIWFQDSTLLPLSSHQMGPNGIRVSPGRSYVYFTFSGSLPGDPAPVNGKLYRLPLVAAPGASDLELVHTFGQYEIPDGITFSLQDELFVVTAGINGLDLYDLGDPDATTLGAATRTHRMNGPRGSTIPYVQPANLAFPVDEKNAYIVNHSLFMPPPPNNFSILRVYVGVKGLKLEYPKPN